MTSVWILDLDAVHLPALWDGDAEPYGHEWGLGSMAVKVRCATNGDGHRCDVDVSDGGSTSHHVVRVAAGDLERWGKGRSVEELVRDSFRFLLEREPKESILKTFDLSVIKRYFPDYDGG